MAGSTPASPTASAAAPARGAKRLALAGPGGVSAGTGWRWSRPFAAARDPVCRPGRSVHLARLDQRDRLRRQAAGAVAGASVRHRRSRAGPARPHDLWRAHLARGRPRGDGRRHLRRRAGRRDRRHGPRPRRHGADVAHRPLPVAAAAAAAAAGHLSVPRLAEGRVRRRGRRLHPDRHRHRRPALDAGGAAGARPVPVAAREGVRRGRARAGRDEICGRSCGTSCPTRSAR
jgi:hypothetical protein